MEEEVETKSSALCVSSSSSHCAWDNHFVSPSSGQYLLDLWLSIVPDSSSPLLAFIEVSPRSLCNGRRRKLGYSSNMYARDCILIILISVVLLPEGQTGKKKPISRTLKDAQHFMVIHVTVESTTQEADIFTSSSSIGENLSEIHRDGNVFVTIRVWGNSATVGCTSLERIIPNNGNFAIRQESLSVHLRVSSVEKYTRHIIFEFTLPTLCPIGALHVDFHMDALYPNVPGFHSHPLEIVF
ncbi:hypothetical protein DMENIID0001_062360 [Sergentomyia squamirostris]